MSRDLLGALWLLVDDLGDARTVDGYRAKCLVVDGAQGPRSSANMAGLYANLTGLNGAWG
jgi:hypothetical protein